jgi:CRP/FNR family transcriptional regulator, cyclic AMP receptor protein
MAHLPAVQTVPDVALFRGLSEEQLSRVASCIHRRHFPASAAIISAETPGEVVYIVLSGTVKIKVDQADGTEVIIAILGPGEIVGELSVIDSSGRSADVLTLEDSVLLWLDRASFENLITTVPTLAHNLLRVLSRRVRLSTEQIQALCTLDVLGKVARQLLVFADQYGEESESGVRIPMRLTQSDLAGMVGASRERVNQVLAGLKARHLISLDASQHITLHGRDKLREIVRQR